MATFLFGIFRIENPPFIEILLLYCLMKYFHAFSLTGYPDA